MRSSLRRGLYLWVVLLVQRQANSLNWKLGLIQIQWRSLVHLERRVFPSARHIHRVAQVRGLVVVVKWNLVILSLGLLTSVRIDWVVESYVSLLLLNRGLLRVNAINGRFLPSSPVGRSWLQALTWGLQVIHRHVCDVCWGSTFIAKHTLNWVHVLVFLSRCWLGIVIVVLGCVIFQLVLRVTYLHRVLLIPCHRFSPHFRSCLSLWVLFLLLSWVEQFVKVESLQYVLSFCPVAFSSSHLPLMLLLITWLHLSIVRWFLLGRDATSHLVCVCAIHYLQIWKVNFIAFHFVFVVCDWGPPLFCRRLAGTMTPLVLRILILAWEA